MRRALPLLILPLLAACVDGAGSTSPLGGLFPGSAAPEPDAAPVLPAAVQAALPPGVPSTVVMQDAAGCYLYSIERTDPPSGYPLRDSAGNPLCDGSLPPASAVAAAPAPLPGTEPQVAAAAPVTPPPTSLPPPAAPESETIDISPVLDAPNPDLTPGNITPPAPIAPLN